MATKHFYLNILFEIAEKNHHLMDQIFVDNNVPLLQLQQLPEPEQEKWKDLHNRSCRIAHTISEVMSKPNRL